MYAKNPARNFFAQKWTTSKITPQKFPKIPSQLFYDSVCKEDASSEGFLKIFHTLAIVIEYKIKWNYSLIAWKWKLDFQSIKKNVKQIFGFV